MPAETDLDSDGVTDLVNIDQTEFFQGLRGLDGAPLFSVEYPLLCASGLTIAADLDGNGDDELLASGNYAVVAVQRSGARHWEALASEGNKEHYGAVLDADGDGAFDVFQPNNHGVYAWDGATGAPLWTYRAPADVAFSSAVAADLDADGAEDVLVAAGDGRLLLLDAATGAEKWALHLGGRAGDPIVADVDADGDAEIVVSVQGELRVYDEGQPARLEMRPGDLHASDAFPRDGQEIELRAVVRNVGGAEARGVAVRLSEDERPVGAEVLDIPPGGEGAAVFRWTARAGERRLVVSTDDLEIERTVRVGP